MENLTLFLDGAIILLLVGTILFASRLSLSLKAFRDNRKAFDQVLHNLDGRIAAAQETIIGLQNAARDGGAALQQEIESASILHDELVLMTQAAENLAQRLERAADGGGRRMELDEPDIEEARIYDLDRQQATTAVPSTVEGTTTKFEDRLRKIEEKESKVDPQEDLQTDVERELAEALKNKKAKAKS